MKIEIDEKAEKSASANSLNRNKLFKMRYAILQTSKAPNKRDEKPLGEEKAGLKSKLDDKISSLATTNESSEKDMNSTTSAQNSNTNKLKSVQEEEIIEMIQSKDIEFIDDKQQNDSI